MSLNNLSTLKCVLCDRNLLKVYTREGHGDTECKIKAQCPCGGESFVKIVKGTCNIAPEPDLTITHHHISDMEFIVDETTGEKTPDKSRIGTTIFVLKENNGKE
jgi:hypothetical protein